MGYRASVKPVSGNIKGTRDTMSPGEKSSADVIYVAKSSKRSARSKFASYAAIYYKMTAGGGI
jgi:hypothetical protein